MLKNISNAEIILLGGVAYLLYRLIKELAWIKLYSFILKLKSEGKLMHENDPNNIEGNYYKKLLNETKSIV